MKKSKIIKRTVVLLFVLAVLFSVFGGIAFANSPPVAVITAPATAVTGVPAVSYTHLTLPTICSV